MPNRDGFVADPRPDVKPKPRFVSQGSVFMGDLALHPNNGVTRNFMPQLWMSLLPALSRRGHEVLLIDGNARPMSEGALVRFAVENDIGLVEIGWNSLL